MGFLVLSALTLLLAGSFTTEAQSENDEMSSADIPAVVFPEGPETCPTGDERELIQGVLSEQIHTILQDSFLSQLPCDKSDIGQSIFTPAASCRKILPTCPSGNYWIRDARQNRPIQMYCDMDGDNFDGTGGWTRIAYLNMTDPDHFCPPSWREIKTPRRTCGRINDTHGSHGGGCSSTTFSSLGISYSRVCGRVIGYQLGVPGAFGPYVNTPAISRSIDHPHIDGVSITYGMDPRKHIWTLAATYREGNPGNTACPCSDPDNPSTITVPPWIGDDYFCESGTASPPVPGVFYPDDRLWDGEDCGAISTCCDFNNPPWFCNNVPDGTTDDIEVRICANQHPIEEEDTPLELIEIYIQ